MTALVAEECAALDAQFEAQAVELRGDRRLLQRLLRNLVENARRHGDCESIVVRLAIDPDQRIRLDVTDQGPGIPAADRENVFAPFYRLPGTSEAAGGVGLGLSLVRQIATAHGGSVQCSCQSNRMAVASGHPPRRSSRVATVLGQPCRRRLGAAARRGAGRRDPRRRGARGGRAGHAPDPQPATPAPAATAWPSHASTWAGTRRTGRRMRRPRRGQRGRDRRGPVASDGLLLRASGGTAAHGRLSLDREQRGRYTGDR